MRIRNRQDHRRGRVLRTDPADALAKALAVGVGRDDDQMRPGAALGPQVAQIPFKLLDHHPVAPGGAAPLQVYGDADLLGDSFNQRANDHPVGMILDEQSDLMHQSRL